MNAAVAPQFDPEMEAYGSRKHDLLKLCEGKFAVFKGSEFLGVYDTAGAAYAAGVARFGNQPFLVKQVTPEEHAEEVPALHLGLFHACL